MIRCVLFDLDGTLLDTAPDLGHALNLLRTEHQLPPVPADACRRVASAGARGLLQLGFSLTPADDAYEPLRQRFLSHYRDHLARETQVFQGIQQVLHELGSRAVQWGIVTNKPGWLTEPLVARMAFPSPPGCIISGDSAALPKPDPAPLFMACEKLDIVPGQCLYVGDAQRDIEAGQRAGMRTLAAKYGYIETGDDPHQWGADGLIEYPHEIIPWLDQYITTKS